MVIKYEMRLAKYESHWVLSGDRKYGKIYRQMTHSIKNIQQMRTVAVVCMDNDYCTELIKGISQYAHERHNFILRHFRPSHIDEGGSFAGCAGIISDAHTRERTIRLKETGLPIVDLSGELEDDPAFISVDIDIGKTASMAAETFLRRGFTSFAYFGFLGKRYSDNMGDAFAAELGKAGHGCARFDADITFNVDNSARNAAKKRLMKWVATLPAHTAVYCFNDVFASALRQSCFDLGRSIPGEIAILGACNCVFECERPPVTLSSIDLNYHDLGYAAMRILASAIENPVKPKPRPTFRITSMKIVERESTAVFPVEPPWLARALSLLEINMDRPLSTADLAAESGVSQPTLQAAMRKQFGMRTGEYILSVKMREAQRLIDEGRLSMKEVAARTGFSSPSYFTNVYKKYYGRSPSKGNLRLA